MRCNPIRGPNSRVQPIEFCWVDVRREAAALRFFLSLLDEDERSINDVFFVTDPTAQTWIDFPATSAHRHDFSFGLVFADSHAEIWTHHDPATTKLAHNRTEQPGNTDLERLARASVTHKMGHGD